MANQPLWAQLAGELRQQLAAGEFDARFPTEAELGARFGVSRATVREAIRRLREDGLLDARRGSGTFVVRRELDAPVLGSAGLARAITAAGLVERSEVLRFAEGPVDAVAGAALGLKAGEPVVWLDRLRFADGETLALETSAVALPPACRAALLEADLAQGSLYDELAKRCNVRITGGREQLRAVTCSAEERRRLRPGRGEGILLVERVAFAGDERVEWRRSLVRGGGYVLGASWGAVPEQLAQPSDGASGGPAPVRS